MLHGIIRKREYLFPREWLRQFRARGGQVVSEIDPVDAARARTKVAWGGILLVTAWEDAPTEVAVDARCQLGPTAQRVGTIRPVQYVTSAQADLRNIESPPTRSSSSSSPSGEGADDGVAPPARRRRGSK